MRLTLCIYAFLALSVFGRLLPPPCLSCRGRVIPRCAAARVSRCEAKVQVHPISFRISPDARFGLLRKSFTACSSRSDGGRPNFGAMDTTIAQGWMNCQQLGVTSDGLLKGGE